MVWIADTSWSDSQVWGVWCHCQFGMPKQGHKSLFWGSTTSPKAQAACEMRCSSTLGLMASSDLLKGAGLLPAWGCPLFPAVCSGACLTPSESRFWSRHQWKTSPMSKQQPFCHSANWTTSFLRAGQTDTPAWGTEQSLCIWGQHTVAWGWSLLPLHQHSLFLRHCTGGSVACEVMSPAQSCSALSGQHGFLHGCSLWSGRHCSRLAAVTHGVFEMQQEEDLCKRYHRW